jgi:hypothetical protein
MIIKTFFFNGNCLLKFQGVKKEKEMIIPTKKGKIQISDLLKNKLPISFSLTYMKRKAQKLLQETGERSTKWRERKES